MAFFHFNTLRKYTASLLNLFNSLEIQTLKSNGKYEYTHIPIQYANREKFDIYTQLSYNQIFTGNTQVLPRAILTFNGMAPAIERARNKFFKIYRKVKVIDGVPQKLNFQYNSVPYNFEFQVLVQCRGMNEASMVIEQVTSFFNPTYCLRIKEIDLPDFGETSIILDLTSTNIEQAEIDEFSSNIVTITFDLNLRGNIYPAIKEQETIKTIQLFLSSVDRNDPENGAVREYAETRESEKTLINQYNSSIKDIFYNNKYLECLIDQECEKLIKFQFDWFVNDVKLESKEQRVFYNLNNGDVVKVRAYTDIVETDFFEKTFFKDEEYAKLSIEDIQYEDDFLECIYKDESKENIKYKFHWFINGIQIPQTQRIIKFKSKPNFSVKCIINTSDGRTSEFYKKIIVNSLEFKDSINEIKDSLNFESNINLSEKTNIKDDFKIKKVQND